MTCPHLLEKLCFKIMPSSFAQLREMLVDDPVYLKTYCESENYSNCPQYKHEKRQTLEIKIHA